jgi:hypothetical protein
MIDPVARKLMFGANLTSSSSEHDLRALFLPLSAVSRIIFTAFETVHSEQEGNEQIKIKKNTIA